MRDRTRVPDRARNATPAVFAALASLAVTCVLLAILAPSFLDALKYFFLSPLSSRYQIGNLLAATSPLLMAGLGIAIAFRAKSFNLGGEGQIYAGGLAAIILTLQLPGMPGYASIPIAILAAALVGTLIGLVSGVLKKGVGIDPLISSFLVSALVTAAADYLIAGPLQDPSSNFRTTMHIGQSQAFGRILSPSSLTWGIFIPFSSILAASWILKNTRFGFELGISGANREFARYAGIDAPRYEVLALAISGGLHGAAGALIVLGTPRAAMLGYSSGIGWSAIAVALLANNSPLALPPAALFYAYLESGAKNLSLGVEVPTEIVRIVQAVIFLFVTAKNIPLARRGASAGGRSTSRRALRERKPS